MTLHLPEGKSGVLPIQYLREAIVTKVIDAGRFSMEPERQLQPASVDLRLGEEAIRIRSSFLPGDDTVERRIKSVCMSKFDIRKEGALLEAGCPYLIKLKERLKLPKGVRAKANPKSSTGRIDVFTRVITDWGHSFDEIAEGYSGPLYLEVVPLSFPIRVTEDLSLNQLRLSVGRVDLGDEDIRAEHQKNPIVYRDGLAVRPEDLVLNNGLFLSLDLIGGSDGRVGYQARRNVLPLDLALSGPTHAEQYWEPVYRQEQDRLVLDKNQFFLLMSKEAVSIPPSLAAEMTAYDPTNGELRTHYAGFFDPGFGYDPYGEFFGSRAALEVRAHDVPFLIEDGQQVCKLTFERMLEEPETLYGDRIRSSYQRQEDALGKQFIPMPSRPNPDPPKRTEQPESVEPPDPRLFEE